MSHHSSEQNSQMNEMMSKLFGEYPNGKLNDNDAGALALAVGHENGAVTITFPKPVAWIGFTPQQAIGIAETLVAHARKCGSKEALKLTIG